MTIFARLSDHPHRLAVACSGMPRRVKVGLVCLPLLTVLGCSGADSPPNDDTLGGTGGAGESGTGGAVTAGGGSPGAGAGGTGASAPAGGSGGTVGRPIGGTGGAVLAGGTGGNEASGGQVGIDPPGSQGEASIWFLAAGADGTVAYAGSIDGQGVTLPPISGAAPRHGYYPWSPDGTLLAQIVDSEVVFYELTDAWNVLSSFPAGPYDSVIAWVPGVGPLLSGGSGADSILGVLTLDGEEFVLGREAPRSGISTVMIAPDGSEVVWAFAQETGRYTLWHQSFEDGVARGTRQIDELQNASPVLSNLWSFDSRWLAFGVSGDVGADVGGAYLWQSGMDAPQMVSPGDNRYTPYISFSSDSEKFAFHVSADEEGVSAIATLSVSGGVIGETHVLDSGVGVSTGTWSRHGSTLTYERDGLGILQEIAADGTAGRATPFSDFHYSCDQRWYSETEFVSGGCENTDALSFFTVTADGLTSESIPGLPAEHLILSQDDQCLIGWSGAGAYIGAMDASPFSPTDIPNAGGDVDWMQLSPDGTQLVWVEDRLVQYRIPIADCMPQGEPTVLVEFESPINDMDFLVGYDR